MQRLGDGDHVETGSSGGRGVDRPVRVLVPARRVKISFTNNAASRQPPREAGVPADGGL